jgi:putative heme-binding domain-containing protein
MKKIPSFVASAAAAAWFATVVMHADSAGTAPAELAPVLKPFALLGNPPPVQMLLPGYVVRELPLSLTNINNLTYSPDGRLFAYAYNGSVYELHDTDGDGLEDKATVYYKNDREVLGGVGMTWGPGGLYFTSRGQIVRLRDRGDGTAELESAASGWTPPDRTAGRNLDSFGIAFDRDGNLFFGLGISDIRNAYRVNPDTGVSTYSRGWDRGTIQKVTPDGQRAIYATGVRFTVALAFNAAGDLFATDQEGATWLPNGNPFDELLHIQPGRHYGFPPRHPKYLPDVIDEPSVFDYGPQHVCTCGLKFNEPRTATGLFGPDWWRGDAFVAGQSRGKLFRTKLVKTAAGYVARTDTLAYFSTLITDIEPSPQGDLVITCHSGRPDNGTGPMGPGKLFKISYRDRGLAQPVFAYPANPTETCLVFDRPVSAEQLKQLTGQVTMAMGEYVTAGDRFDSFVPGYQAVKDQQKVPRYQLPVASTRLAPDRRTLIVTTGPRTGAVKYSIGLTDIAQPTRAFDEAKHELRQQSAVDVLMDLTGAQALWRDAKGADRWTGWLPHLDLAVARGFTAPSSDHAAFFAHLREPGTLELKTQLNLYSMLHPAVQPGSKLDYEYPPEVVHVRFAGSAKLQLVGSDTAAVRRISDNEAELTVEPATRDWVPVTLTLETGNAEPSLAVTWWTAEDDRPRALPLHRIVLPWATRQDAAAWVGVRAEIPEIKGGDWEHGRSLFYGKATCATCHSARGQGGTLGPDLTNLVHRDYASVLFDITQPSATLNPEYIAVTLELKNSRTAVGTLLQSWNQVYVLGQVNGDKLTFPRDEVLSVKPLGLSLMPPGLLDALSEQERKDLLTFLLRETPESKR